VKAFGVAASPRVTTSRHVRRGGGRAQIGRPYKVRGKWYRPREQPGYSKVGMASWYGPNFHGRLTANGEIYDQYALSGAHPTFPLPSYARVTNLANGNSVVVRVNDRGPYAHGRVIDMSAKAAELLDYKRKGIAKVRVKYIGKARLDGRDQRFLLASYKPGSGYRRGPSNTVPGVMLASSRPSRSVGSIPVSSFVHAPFPKERPVFTGGIPLDFQAYHRLEPVEPQTGIVSIEPRDFAPRKLESHKLGPHKLEPMSPAMVQKLRNRFIISSYAARQRINNAHLAAQRASRFGTGIKADDVRRLWKRGYSWKDK